MNKTIRDDVEIVISVIPSSVEGLAETPIRLVAKELRGGCRIDGTSCLVRKYTVTKKHEGGSRNLIEEIQSLKVQNNDIIKDKVVIVLDDITTSGVSMDASIKLFKEAGARKVYGLAIAKTSDYLL